MTLLEVEEAIRFNAIRQIQSGAMSVKLLAHLTKLQSPQTSNFLRRRRNLSIRSMSRIIGALGLEIEVIPRNCGARQSKTAAPLGTAPSTVASSRPRATA